MGFHLKSDYAGTPYRASERTPENAYPRSPLQERGLRSYSPGMGRWLRPDPIGFRGGVNRLAYVLNRPSGWIDPIGLQKKSEKEIEEQEHPWPGVTTKEIEQKVIGACVDCGLRAEDIRAAREATMTEWERLHEEMGYYMKRPCKITTRCTVVSQSRCVCYYLCQASQKEGTGESCKFLDWPQTWRPWTFKAWECPDPLPFTRSVAPAGRAFRRRVREQRVARRKRLKRNTDERK